MANMDALSILALGLAQSGGGGGGTSDYSDLSNKPQINSVTLSGNKSLSDLGIPTYTAGDNVTISNNEISVEGLELEQDSQFVQDAVDKTNVSGGNVNLSQEVNGIYSKSLSLNSDGTINGDDQTASKMFGLSTSRLWFEDYNSDRTVTIMPNDNYTGIKVRGKDVATTDEIPQPDGTTITESNGIWSAVGGGSAGAVRYDEAQVLTDAQKNQAKANQELPYVSYAARVHNYTGSFTLDNATAPSGTVSGTVLVAWPALNYRGNPLFDIVTTIDGVVVDEENNLLLQDNGGWRKPILPANSIFSYIQCLNGNMQVGFKEAKTGSVTIDWYYKDATFNNVLRNELVEAPTLPIEAGSSSNYSFKIRGANNVSVATDGAIALTNTNARGDCVQGSLIAGYGYNGTKSFSATNNGAIAGGYANTTGYGMRAGGQGSIAAGVSSGAPSSTITTSSRYAIEAAGDGSIARGYFDNNSTAGTIVSAKAAVGIGEGISCDTPYSIVFGKYNIGDSREYSFNTYYYAGERVYYQGHKYEALSNFNASGKAPSGSTTDTEYWKYISDDLSGHALIIGNGTASNARSNALTVDWDGNLVCNNIPACPSADGTYNLQVTITSGVPTYSWVAQV